MNKIDLLDRAQLLNPGQKKVCQLLKELDEICRRNGIVYYASGGTALGAIRHNGFIPWDDDADVHMTRDNFNKLINLPKSEFPANREITCWETNPDYNHTSARYIDTNTTVLYRHHTTTDYPAGLMVDIVVLEPMPADPKKWDKHMNLFLAWSEFRTPESTSTHRWPGKAWCWRYKVLDKIIGRKRLLKYLEKRIFCEPDDENTTAYHQRWAPVPWIFSKDLFGEPRRLPFGDMMLAVPGNVEDFLTQSYTDDWYMIPGASVQTSHTSIEHDSLPSSVFSNDYVPYLNRKEMPAKYAKRANNLIRNRKFRANFAKDNLYFYTKKAQQEIDKYLLDNNCTIKDVIDRRDYTALGEMLTRYMDAQYATACIGNITYAGWVRRHAPILLDLSDDVTYAGLLLAMHNSMLSKADRVLKARYAKDAAVPENIKELRGLVDAIHKAASCFYHDKLAEAGAICEEWLAKFDDNPDLLRMYMAIKFRELSDEESEKELLERVLPALKMHPGDDVLRFIASELLSKDWCADREYTVNIKNDKDEDAEVSFKAAQFAEYLIEQIFETGRNGRILMIIRKRLEEQLREEPDNEEIYYKLKRLLERTGIEFPEDDKDGEIDEPVDADESDDTLSDMYADKDEETQAGTYRYIMLELLKELDALCKENDIEYFTTGYCALASGRQVQISSSFANAKIAMTPDNFLKLRKVVLAQGRSDRKLDSMLDNKNFPHFAARYTNENTLHFPVCFHKYYASRGLAVEIEFIRSSNNSRSAKIAYALESSWEFMHYKFFGYRKKPAIGALALRVIGIFTGKKFIAKKIFEKCQEAGKPKQNKKWFIRPYDAKQKTKHYPYSVFEEAKRGMLENAELSFPAELERYLDIYFGTNWEKRKICGSCAGVNNIKDANLSYLDYEALLDNKKVNKCWKSMKHLNNINAKNQETQKSIVKYWHIMLRSEARVKLYEKYAPMKKDILLMHEQGKHEELFELLADYYEQIVFFAKWDMGLCFDKEIFDVMVETMRNIGLKEEAEALLNTTPADTYSAPDMSF